MEATSYGEQNLILEEYIQGDPLHELLKGCLFTEEETKSIIRDVCRGLWLLHSLGAVHWDVKPENIVLREDHAVLIDFDAARLTCPKTYDGLGEVLYTDWTEPIRWYLHGRTTQQNRFRIVTQRRKWVERFASPAEKTRSKFL